MSSMNKVFLMGNLTRDPDVRYLPSGTAVADLGIAVNERYRDKKSDEWKEMTTFVDVTVWGRQAETSAEYLSKGSPALIEGRLQMDEWENKQGEKRSKLKVRADRVQFLGSRSSNRTAYEDSPDRSSTPPPDSKPASGSDAGSAPVEDDDNLPF